MNGDDTGWAIDEPVQVIRERATKLAAETPSMGWADERRDMASRVLLVVVTVGAAVVLVFLGYLIGRWT